MVRTDFEGVRVQFQGDRVQGLFHRPDDRRRVRHRGGATRPPGCSRASSWCSRSCSRPSPRSGRRAASVRATTIATKLGERGHRDRICLGADVLRAEANEERVGKQEVGISGNVRDHLPEEVASLFDWDAGKNCFVASGLDQSKLDLLQDSKAYRQNQPVYVKPGASGVVIGTKPNQGRPVQPSRPWSA